MWMKEVFLGFIGLASGTAVSAGVFSFIITVGDYRKEPDGERHYSL